MTSIVIILVIYKTRLADSVTYQRLQRCRDVLSWADTKLIVYNNSPETPLQESGQYIAVNAERNEKLAAAYNYALQYATENRYEWLMLLDQDTELTEEYFSELRKFFDSKKSGNTAAVVPMFKNKSLFLSPRRYNAVTGPVWGKKNIGPGETYTYMSAFNSCAVINVKAILSISGFPEEYPLDALDTCYFYRLHRAGYVFHVIPVTMTQNLSVLDYKSMTIERYMCIVEADKRMAQEIGVSASFFLRLRMLCRCSRFATDRYKRKYIGVTLKHLF